MYVWACKKSINMNIIMKRETKISRMEKCNQENKQTRQKWKQLARCLYSHVPTLANYSSDEQKEIRIKCIWCAKYSENIHRKDKYKNCFAVNCLYFVDSRQNTFRGAKFFFQQNVYRVFYQVHIGHLERNPLTTPFIQIKLRQKFMRSLCVRVRSRNMHLT